MHEWKLRKKDDRYEVRDLKLQDFILSTTSLKQGKATTGHSHVYEEAYCFIKGCGTLVLGESSQEVKAGHIIIVPGRTFHRVFNNGCPELLFLCVFKRKAVAVAGGFDPIHIGHIRHMKAAKKLGTNLLPLSAAIRIWKERRVFTLCPLNRGWRLSRTSALLTK